MRIILKTGLVIVALTFAATNANAWYCVAESKNGATGTGFHFFQDLSEKAALQQCRVNSKGKRCHISWCI